MKISYLRIKNFKSIQDLEIKEMDNALILVGKNNTGKTVVIDAICLAAGQFEIKPRHFLNQQEPVTIAMEVELGEQDLANFHLKGLVSEEKQYDLWEQQFKEKVPSYQEGKVSFICKVTPEGAITYDDGYQQNNPYIREIFPKTYHIDHTRNIQEIQEEVFRFHDENSLQEIRDNVCSYDPAKKCNRCFRCMESINKKSPEELSIFETVRLMEYKMMAVNINEITDKLNYHFHQNGSGFPGDKDRSEFQS